MDCPEYVNRAIERGWTGLWMIPGGHRSAFDGFSDYTEWDEPDLWIGMSPRGYGPYIIHEKDLLDDRF